MARRFSRRRLAQIDAGRILWIRAGRRTSHRFIGIWVVVVNGRVFVRSWSLKRRGWYRTLLEEPRGAVQIADREITVRAVHRSERVKDAVDRAYLEKYNTRAAIKYSKDLVRAKSRDTTIELIPC